MTGNQIEEYWRKINEAKELISQLSHLFGAYAKKEVPEFLLRKIVLAQNDLYFIKEFLLHIHHQNLTKKLEEKIC